MPLRQMSGRDDFMITCVALVAIVVEAPIAGNRWFPMRMMVAIPIGAPDDLAHFRSRKKSFEACGPRKISRGLLEFELFE